MGNVAISFRYAFRIITFLGNTLSDTSYRGRRYRNAQYGAYRQHYVGANLHLYRLIHHGTDRQLGEFVYEYAYQY